MGKKSKEEFKKAFGIEEKSTNWDGFLQAMDKGLEKLDMQIKTLEACNADDAANRRHAYTHLAGAAACRSSPSGSRRDRSAALRNFRRQHNLPVTGRPDSATISALGIPCCSRTICQRFAGSAASSVLHPR